MTSTRLTSDSPRPSARDRRARRGGVWRRLRERPRRAPSPSSTAPTISKAELDELFAQAKKGYEAQKQEFPKAGTPEYQSIQTQYVAYLVELAEFRQAAEELGVAVTEKDVDNAADRAHQDPLRGQARRLREGAEAAGASRRRSTGRRRSRVSALSKKLFDAVTKDVKVSEQDVLAYYTQNQSQYGTPESRDVRHILIRRRSTDGKVDFAASKAKADEIYAQLKAGARLRGAREGELGRSRQQELRAAS